MKAPVKYDYDKPIKIIQSKRNGFDIMFYSSILTFLVVGVLYLVCIHDGKFKIEFKLWEVLLSMPLIILAYFFKQLLDELKKYPKLLREKHIWNINELMNITKKDRKATEDIMNHVLESAFVVDPKCIKKWKKFHKLLKKWK